MSDPTYGRIDPDIKKAIEEIGPASLGQRVAMENTLQERRNQMATEDGVPAYTCRTTFHHQSRRLNLAAVRLKHEVLYTLLRRFGYVRKKEATLNFCDWCGSDLREEL